MKSLPIAEKPSAHYPRHNHDFSARRVYTSKAGMIKPVKPIDTIPNEHIEINVSDFLQSMPLATAAFLRGRREFSFYYVPITQLWANFGQYMAQRKDRYSSALKDSKYEPRISLRCLFVWCLNAMFYDLSMKVNKAYNSGNVLLGNLEITAGDTSRRPILSNVFNPITKVGGTKLSTTLDVPTSSYFAANVFMKFENDVATSYQPTVGEFVLDRFGMPRWSNMLRKLDLLRYGNYINYFSNAYDLMVAFSDGDESITQDDVDNAFKDLIHQIDIIPDDYFVEPYRLLAYNKCYYTFFRNSYYELDYYVGDYNVDHLQCNSLETSILTASMFSVQFLDMYQHQWKKDLFTSLMPDTQFGAVSSLEMTDNVLLSNLFSGVQTNAVKSNGAPMMFTQAVSSSDAIIDAESQVLGGNYIKPLGTSQQDLKYWNGLAVDTSMLNDQTNPDGLDLSVSFDVLALRRAQAIQGYRQTLLRCGNKTKDIMVGLYGVEPVWENDHDPAFIDAFGYDFMVDRVVSQALTNDSLETTDGKLGDLGGYIAKLGSSQHTIKYTTRGDFGIIMPLCYEIFESEYNSYNIDPNLLPLTPEEHGIPDFMNLGFVPVTRRILSLIDNRVYDDNNQVLNYDSVLGYSTPYYEKKVDIDVCHGITNTIASPSRRPDGSFIRQLIGDFAHWVAPRSDMQSAFVTLVKQFYIDPRILNGNFLLSADGRQETDQFICNTYFKVSRINWLTKLGLPNF